MTAPLLELIVAVFDKFRLGVVCTVRSGAVTWLPFEIVPVEKSIVV